LFDQFVVVFCCRDLFSIHRRWKETEVFQKARDSFNAKRCQNEKRKKLKEQETSVTFEFWLKASMGRSATPPTMFL
jgi:hypothetical protein